MQASGIPAKFPTPFGATGTKNTIPATQSGLAAGRASFDVGFPPATFTPVSAGGTAPFGADFNGVLYDATAWAQWQQAGAPVAYDSSFQTAISGYPNGALVASATTAGLWWLSTADNNTTNPDTGGAGWTRVPLAQIVNYFVDSGAVNALVVTPSPAAAALVAGMTLRIKVANANTSSSVTLNVSGLGAIPVTRLAGAALAVGDLVAGGIAEMAYDGTQWQMLGYLRTGSKTQNYQAAGTFSLTVAAGVYAIFAKIWGGGGGGGGANASNYGYGAAGGGYTEGWFPVTPGQVITVVVGAGGTAGTSGAGTNGGTSSFGSLASSTGGQGGQGSQAGQTTPSVSLGGSGTGGTFSQTGCNGGTPLGSWSASFVGGFGGGSYGGNGGIAASNQTGQVGAGPGAGGAAGTGNSGTAQPGAAGQLGAVLLSW